MKNPFGDFPNSPTFKQSDKNFAEMFTSPKIKEKPMNGQENNNINQRNKGNEGNQKKKIFN